MPNMDSKYFPADFQAQVVDLTELNFYVEYKNKFNEFHEI